MIRVKGAECPRCGFEGGEDITGPGITGRNPKGQSVTIAPRRRICDHCGERFAIQDQPLDPKAVLYRPTVVGGATCPSCGAHPWKVTRTMPRDGSGYRIRYHTCESCNYSGKSTEKENDSSN